MFPSPVTEDVPPRRDRSIHGVPPSVTGLVHSRSVPLHPTSVNGLVHSPSVHSVNALHAYMPTDVCALSWLYAAEFNQCNCIQPSATTYTIAKPQRTFKVPKSATYFPAFGCFQRTFAVIFLSHHFTFPSTSLLSLRFFFCTISPLLLKPAFRLSCFSGRRGFRSSIVKVGKLKVWLLAKTPEALASIRSQQ